MINNVNIFTIHKSLLRHIIKILPTIYQNKTKVPEESSKCRVKLQGEVN